MSRKELRKKLEAEIGSAISALLKKMDAGAEEKSRKVIREASKTIARKFYKNAGDPPEMPQKRMAKAPVKKVEKPVKVAKAAGKSKK